MLNSYPSDRVLNPHLMTIKGSYILSVLSCLLQVSLIGDSKELSTDAVIASAPVTSRQNRPKSVPVHLHRQPDMVRF